MIQFFKSLITAIKYPNVGGYLLASVIHWEPRRKMISQAIDELKLNNYNNNSFDRIIDIGCGPGMLAPTVLQMRLKYLGIDIDPRMIEYCLVRKSDSGESYEIGDSLNLHRIACSRDIIIMNGVLHHLDEKLVNELIKMTQNAYGVIIADHLKISESKNILVNFMQRMDRGKYVRNFHYFNNLQGLQLVTSQKCGIKLFGVKLWDYFCNTYLSKPIDSIRD